MESEYFILWHTAIFFPVSLHGGGCLYRPLLSCRWAKSSPFFLFLLSLLLIEKERQVQSSPLIARWLAGRSLILETHRAIHPPSYFNSNLNWFEFLACTYVRMCVWTCTPRWSEMTMWPFKRRTMRLSLPHPRRLPPTQTTQPARCPS